MNRKAKVSLLFGLFMAFSFTINSLIKEEAETVEEIQKNFIAIIAAGIVSGGLLYFFVKNSHVDRIWGNKKEE
jgi:prolipoprotein diacylglyceryltransferase